MGLLMCLTNGSCDCVNSSAYCPVIEFHTEGVRGANLGAAVVRYRADLELHRRIERRGQFRSSFSASPVQFLRQRAKASRSSTAVEHQSALRCVCVGLH